MKAQRRSMLVAAALAAACACAATECRAAQEKPLSISSSPVTAGGDLYLDVRLDAPISVPFDVYCFADTTYGVFTLGFGGRVIYGLQASYRNVWGREFPFACRVHPRVRIPRDMRYNSITFYLFTARAGEWIPFTFLEELGPDTANIIFFDSVKVPVR